MSEERAEFEKWQIVPLEWQVRPKHPYGGRYVDDRIEEQWIVWQAAYAAGKRAGDRELVEALQFAINYLPCAEDYGIYQEQLKFKERVERLLALQAKEGE